MDSPKLAISFSGGKSSAVMTYLCLKKYSQTHDIVVTFANTGSEHQGTLDFINECDKKLGFNVVWLEADINPKMGIGIKHKIVNYQNASRKNEPFEAFVKKYGIPNKAYPQCTSRLKTDVMESYLRSIGFVRGKYRENPNYDTAIGIRYDEIDRMSDNRKKWRLIYPLIEEKITKPMVNAIINDLGVNLKIPGSHYGNCVFCWKKSFRKLMTIAKENPKYFDFPKNMELLYSTSKSTNKPRYFYRDNTNTETLLQMAGKNDFIKYTDSKQISIFDIKEYDFFDLENGRCGDSCETY